MFIRRDVICWKGLNAGAQQQSEEVPSSGKVLTWVLDIGESVGESLGDVECGSVIATAHITARCSKKTSR